MADLDKDAQTLNDLAIELARDLGCQVESITLHVCGAKRCEHQWGKLVEVSEGVFTVQCLKCGRTAFEEAQWL